MNTFREAITTMIEGEARETVGHLSSAQDARAVAAVALSAYRRAESVHLPMVETLACKRGCAWCCRGIKVDVTVPEAVLIAEFLRWSLSAEHFQAIADEIREAARVAQTMTIDQRWQAQTPCPLLDEESGTCLVYQVRPMRCRGHNSTNADACALAARNPTKSLGVPVDQNFKGFYDAMTAGQVEGMRRANADDRTFELSNALSVAMTAENAAVRWQRGERVFDVAHYTIEDEEESHRRAVDAISRRKQNERKRAKQGRS